MLGAFALVGIRVLDHCIIDADTRSEFDGGLAETIATWWSDALMRRRGASKRSAAPAKNRTSTTLLLPAHCQFAFATQRSAP